METNQYFAGESQFTSGNSIAREVTKTYSEQGAQAAWAQLSAFDHANRTTADMTQYNVAVSELQRNGVLPQLQVAARESLKQAQQPSAQRHVEAPVQTQVSPYVQRQVEAPAQRQTSPYPQRQVEIAQPTHSAQTAQPQNPLMQNIISVAQRERTGQLDQAGRTWLDSAVNYLSKTQTPQDFQKSLSQIEAAKQKLSEPTPRSGYNLDMVESGDAPRNQIVEGLRLAGIANPTEAQIAAIDTIGTRESHWQTYPAGDARRASKGPMQMYNSTFWENHVEGHNNVHSVVDSVASATRYIANRYGDGTPGSGLEYVAGRHHWY